MRSFKIINLIVFITLQKINGSNTFSKLFLGKSSNGNHSCCLCTAAGNYTGVKTQQATELTSCVFSITSWGQKLWKEYGQLWVYMFRDKEAKEKKKQGTISQSDPNWGSLVGESSHTPLLRRSKGHWYNSSHAHCVLPVLQSCTLGWIRLFKKGPEE